MITRSPESCVSRLEYWHAAWEQDNPEFVSTPSFILTEDNSDYIDMYARDPRFEDILVLLEMYGFCEHMLLVLSWSKKFKEYIRKDELLGDWVLPINTVSRSDEHFGRKRYRLVYRAWHALTGSQSDCRDVARALAETPGKYRDPTESDTNQRLASETEYERSRIREDVPGQWRDRKCRCKTEIRIRGAR